MMQVEGDWQRDGYVVLRNAYGAAAVASLLEVAEHCWAQYEIEPHAAQGTRDPGASMADATSMRHLNHPGYLTPGSGEDVQRPLISPSLPTRHNWIARGVSERLRFQASSAC